jgi:hypothetical protein
MGIFIVFDYTSLCVSKYTNKIYKMYDDWNIERDLYWKTESTSNVNILHVTRLYVR